MFINARLVISGVIIVLYLSDFVLFRDFHFLIIKRVLYLIPGFAEMRRVMFIKM